jgi:hypothetical protein
VNQYDADQFRESLPDRLAPLGLKPGDHLRALVVGHERIGFADWTTGKNSRPSLETLARRTGMSRNSVAKADSNLVAAKVTEKTGTHGRQRTPVYALLPVRDGALVGCAVVQGTRGDELETARHGAPSERAVDLDGAFKGADGASKGANGASGGRVTPTPTGREEEGARGDFRSPASGGSLQSSPIVDYIEDLSRRIGLGGVDPTHAELIRAIDRCIVAGLTPDELAARNELAGLVPTKSAAGLLAIRIGWILDKPIIAPAQKKATKPAADDRIDRTLDRLVPLLVPGTVDTVLDVLGGHPWAPDDMSFRRFVLLRNPRRALDVFSQESGREPLRVLEAIRTKLEPPQCRFAGRNETATN